MNLNVLRKRIAARIVCCILIGFICTLLVWHENESRRQSTASAYAETAKRLVMVASAIKDYYASERRLPNDLGELRHAKCIDSLPEYVFKDYWGGEISYAFEKQCIAILGSFGRDARAGGLGLDGDWEIRVVTLNGKSEAEVPRIVLGKAPVSWAELQRKYLAASPWSFSLDEK